MTPHLKKEAHGKVDSKNKNNAHVIYIGHLRLNEAFAIKNKQTAMKFLRQ